MFLELLLLAQGVGAIAIRPNDVDGSHLEEGRSCYDILLGDEFVVRQSDLLPISLISERGTDRYAPAWQRITISYERDWIRGTRETTGGIVPILVRSSSPVWDGNLWGPLFASLPLAESSQFVVPLWQYDKGFGQFEVRVAGTGPVSHPAGTEQAWLLEVGIYPDRLTRYAISRSSREELSYKAGPMRKVKSGDCIEPSELR